MASIKCVNCGKSVSVDHLIAQEKKRTPTGGTIFPGSIFSAYVDDGNTIVVTCSNCGQGHRVDISKHK